MRQEKAGGDPPLKPAEARGDQKRRSRGISGRPGQSGPAVCPGRQSPLRGKESEEYLLLLQRYKRIIEAAEITENRLSEIKSDNRFSYCIILEAEVIRAVAGLGKFKHDAVAVVGMAAYNCHTVVVIDIQF